MDEPISARTVRMNQLLMGKTTKTTGGQILSLVNRECLLDSLFVLYEECNNEELRKDKYILAFIEKFRAAVVEFKKLRVNHNDFEIKQVIGMGHFGHVQVVRERQTGDVYAMKVLRKSDTLSKQNVAFYEEERDIMAKANSLWITQLQYAFQDKNNIYLVMEYHPGGDLLNLLDRFEDVFPEDMARFYIAEIAIAINVLHNMGYVHRDIKPDNVLLDRTGHIKLADFGSAAQLTVHGTVNSKMPVGTPDYVAPEVLACLENCSGTYGKSCDWWSLGIVAYEMLFGKTPFTDDKVVTLYNKIMNHKATLLFPEESLISTAAITLVRGLLDEVENRLDFPHIVNHPYFEFLIWETIRDYPPPFVPVVISQDDTSNFSTLKPVQHKPDLSWQDKSGFSGKNLPFVGFSYTKLMEAPQESSESGKTVTVSSRRESSFNKQMHTLLERNSVLEKQDIINLSKIKSLERRLNDEEFKSKCLRDKLIKKKEQFIEVQKVREQEHTKRLETESKSVELIKEMEKRKELKMNYIFQQELERSFLKLKKCEDRYAETSNEKDALQRKYEELAKQVEFYKNQTSINIEKTSRRSLSSDVIQIETLQNKIGTLERNAEETNKKNRALKDKLNNAQETTKQLEIQINQLERTSKLTEDHKSAYEKDLLENIAELQEKLNKSQLLSTDVKSKLKDKNIDIEVMEKKIKYLYNENEKLKGQNQILLSEKSDGDRVRVVFKNEEIQDELNILKNKNFQLLEELIHWKQSDLEKSCMVDELRSHVSVLEEGLKQSSVESFFSVSSGSEEEARTEKDDRIITLSSEIVLLKAKISNLETQLERSKENLSREKQEARETRSEFYKTERELKDCKIDLRIAQRECKTAVEQLNANQSKTSKTESEKENLLKRVSELELSSSQLESELQKVTLRKDFNERKWSTEKSGLENQMAALKTSNGELKDIQIKLNQADGRIAELVTKIQALEKQTKMQEIEAKDWQETKIRLKDNLKQEVEKRQNHELNANLLRNIAADLEDQVQQLTSLVAIHEVEEVRLKDELARLTNDLKTAKSDLTKEILNTDREKANLQAANKKVSDLEAKLEMKVIDKDKEMSHIIEQKNEYYANVMKLSQYVDTIKEELENKENDCDIYLKKIASLTAECDLVKEQASILLTKIQSQDESKLILESKLDDANVKIDELVEKFTELESTFQENKATHYSEKFKLEEKIAQQTKLIDFLQSKLETPGKKKKTLQEKLFGRKQTVVVSPSMTKKPHYKIEMSPSKIYTYPGRRKDCTSSQLKSNFDVQDALHLSKSPTEERKSNGLRYQKSEPISTSERMHHNIPHRFNIGLCLHPTKCAVCMENINFGRNVARCEECNVPLHPKCSNSMPDTCNLPIGLMQHYRHSMKQKRQNIKTEKSSEYMDVDSSICGWLKIFKSGNGNQGWDRLFAKLKGNILFFYTKEDCDSSLDSIDISPSDGIVKVVEVVLPNELSGLAKSDMPFIFKLEVIPLTTCWPGRCVYLMACSLSDKLNWVSTLEKIANLNANVCKSICGDIGTNLLSINDAKGVDLNCVAYLNDDTMLVGAEEGLYVVDMMNNSRCVLITHFVSIINIQWIASLNMVILITGTDHRLYWIEVNALKKIINGTVKYKAEALQLLNPIENIDACHLITISESGNNVLLCAATAEKISILKWNAQMKSFFLRRILSTAEPCGCALFTSDSLIMGTDKFYEIDLQTFTVEDFLDESDLSLKHVIMSATEMQSFPVAIFQIALSGLPEEYLVCYHEMGVFVDSFGHRSRSQDVTWSRIPLGFAFRWPYLYIIHFSSIEVRKTSVHRDECFEMQTHIDLASPRHLGNGFETGTIVIATTKDDSVEILSFDGELAVKQRMCRLQNENNSEEADDSDSIFSFTSSVLEALEESEL